MSDNSIIKSLEVVLEPLGEDARNTVLLAVEENWRWPPMTRETVTGEGDDFANFLKRWPSITNQESGILDFDKVDQMMATGQIAYPMMLKKAPIISIVRSASGFTIKSSDEQFSKIALENLKEVLPKKIEEVLTYLEYGAYFGEITYEPVYPQIYGLPKSDIPYWVISDFNGVHPNTITKILRNEDTKVFEGFIQQPAGFHEPVEVGVERALIIPNNGMFGNLNGTSVLEPVYVWWFWYEMVWRAFLRFLQRAGVGVVVVKAPSRGRVEVGGKSVDNMQWALQMASSLHRTNYAVVPSDMDSDSGNPLWVIDYLKMGQNEGAQFAAALELLSTNIKNYLLTGNSGAPTEGAEFEVMLDTERILGHIGMYVSEYILPKMLYWNNSDTNKATLEFQGANSRVLPLLFKLMAVAGNTAGDALQNVDWRLLFNKGGVPVLSEEEVEELKEEKKKEQEEMMHKKQAASAKPQFGRPNNPDEKAKMPPGGEGRWTAKRDEEGQAERLSMVKEALRVPLIALTAGQVAELEYMGLRLPDDRPIAIYDLDRHEDTVNELKLYNPYHSEKGEFTTKWKAVKVIKDPNYVKWKEEHNARLREDYDYYRQEERIWAEAPHTGLSYFMGSPDKEPRSAAKTDASRWKDFVGKHGLERALWQIELDMEESVSPGKKMSDWDKEYYDELLFEVSKLKGPSKKLEDEYKLFNPYHDEHGRFTSRERATGSPSFAEDYGVGPLTEKEKLVNATARALGYAAFGSWATGIVSQVIGGPIRKAKSKSPNDKAFSIKIRDKEWSMTYGEIEHKGTKVGKFGKWAYLAASAFKFATLGMMANRWSQANWSKEHPGEEWPGFGEASRRWHEAHPNYEPSWKTRSRRSYDEEYVRKSREWSEKYEREYKNNFSGPWKYGSKGGMAGWPSGATEDQFKTMYRDLAKKWHPDRVSTASADVQQEFAEIMKEINVAYRKKDWQTLAALHKKLEAIIEQNDFDEFMIANLVFLRVVMEAVNSDIDFIAIESGEPIEPFPYEDGMIFIDVETAKKIINMTKVLAEMPMPIIINEDAKLEDDAGDDRIHTGLSRW